MTQRIELRKRAATSEAVVCWNRVLPSTEGNHAWPNGCKGNPTPQMCTQATVSLTASETYKYNEWVSNGKPYIPGCGMTPPSATSINWKTQYAYLLASDMVITANGKVFKGATSGPMTVHSNPASATYTTLESTWTENGVEMRMYIYFDASACTKSLPPQCNWRITELRIYNGNAQGDWIYFKGGDTISVGARVGTAYTNPSLTLTSSESGIGKITFTNIRLQAFTNQVTTTPTPTSCLNQKNGTPCSINSCVTTKCTADGRCFEEHSIGGICSLTPGTCLNSQCVATTSGGICGGIRGDICQPGYSCIYSSGSTKAQYPDESGRCVAQTTTCTLDGTACSLRVCPTMSPCPEGRACPQVMPPCTLSTGVCKTGRCMSSITPTPTCIPRPACMDPLPGQPRCMPDIPQGGWICPQTPTPTTAQCKTGLNSFSVGIGCPNDSGQFLTATYVCYDGVKGTVGNKTTCQTSLALANLAQQACAGHSSCITPPPSCIPLPECAYNPPIVNGRPVLCSIPPPPNGKQYCPRPTVTPTVTSKPGDFNGDGKVNIFDYNVVLANFGKSGPVGFSPADLNADGKVNLFDYNMILNYFGK